MSRAEPPPPPHAAASPSATVRQIHHRLQARAGDSSSQEQRAIPAPDLLDSAGKMGYHRVVPERAIYTFGNNYFEDRLSLKLILILILL